MLGAYYVCLGKAAVCQQSGDCITQMSTVVESLEMESI